MISTRALLRTTQGATGGNAVSNLAQTRRARRIGPFWRHVYRQNKRQTRQYQASQRRARKREYSHTETSVAQHFSEQIGLILAPAAGDDACD